MDPWAVAMVVSYALLAADLAWRWRSSRRRRAEEPDRELREGPMARWKTAHEILGHPDGGLRCYPCLTCKHDCHEHERLMTSHDERLVCHVRGCDCWDFSGIRVKGVRRG